MIVFIEIVLLGCIGVLLYCTYGAWFKQFGEKHYDVSIRFRRFMPWLIIGDRKTHVFFYKVGVTLSLLLLIAVFISFLVPSLRHTGGLGR